MKTFTTALILLFSYNLYASDFLSWKELQVRLERAGGNTKMLKHVKCLFEKGEERSFEFKPPRSSSYDNRCYKRSQYEIGNKRSIALIDYTVASNKKRLFLVDRKTGAISKMAVAHGRYQSSYIRRRKKYLHNTVKWASYFSNAFGSNAPSSGFFLAGQEYYGKWDRSLVLNGLEQSVNDNACERAVVMHAHSLVSNNKARVMSSGCPMVSKKNINQVIDTLKGKGSNSRGLEEAGSVVFIYGKREAKWDEDYCGEI